MNFKQELKSYCLLIKKENFFLDNFISILTLDRCLKSEIESIKNGMTIIEKKEHDKKYKTTNKLYIDLKNYIGNVNCECSM